jgi:hypothetical protein
MTVVNGSSVSGTAPARWQLKTSDGTLPPVSTAAELIPSILSGDTFGDVACGATVTLAMHYFPALGKITATVFIK